MGKQLVFEIGTEELPSSCINEGVTELKKIISRKLGAERIAFSSLETYGTPRRLAAVAADISDKQKSHKKVVTGPPKKIAFDSKGKPTKAAIGFAASIGIGVSELEEIKTDRGIYMGKNVLEKGKPSIEVLPELLKESITEINFSKQMSWGDSSLRFARPIRWILALLGEELLNFELENLKSQRFTYGLRCLEGSRIEIRDAQKYIKLLEEEGMVVLDSARRKKIIADGIHVLENKLWNRQKQVVMETDLLDEVVNLVEFPQVLAGNFNPKYLYMPKDILSKAIQYHQKYFPVMDMEGNIATNFVIVQNGPGEPNSVTKGNQRVLEARLSDATFFYEEDRKHDFGQWLEKLKGVIFYSGIGSMHDKVQRLKNIVSYLVSHLGKQEIKSRVLRAAQICKCDLVTNMVVEFPQLQGIVGREYALENGEEKEVARAVYEHYLPRFAQDSLPRDDTGTLLSIADKMDTICGMFILGNIPTGSEDPFALRRKASGMAASILEKDYSLKLAPFIGFVVSLYRESFDIEEDECPQDRILDFIYARYRFSLEKQGSRLDLADAIISTGLSSLTGINKRYQALENYISQRKIELIANPMIRCQNIIRGKDVPALKTELFKEEDEIRLHEAVLGLRDSISKKIDREQYFSVLIELEDFGKIVDRFFDQVLVMDQDQAVRQNRMSLVKSARDLYLNLADFSKLVIEG